MIQTFHVGKSFGKYTALDDISLQVGKGEFVILTGPSGSGKTTLLKLFLGLLRPDSGQILIQNRNITRLRESGLPYFRRTIGVVFQDFKLLSRKSVFENVAVAMRIVGAAPAEIRRRVTEVLAGVGLDSKKNMLPFMLSAGEQQRVCLARAIVNHPVLLLADEPTGNLDADQAARIYDLLKLINERGTTVLLTTHRHEIPLSGSRRLIRLQQGRIVGGGA